MRGVGAGQRLHRGAAGVQQGQGDAVRAVRGGHRALVAQGHGERDGVAGRGVVRGVVDRGGDLWLAAGNLATTCCLCR